MNKSILAGALAILGAFSIPSLRAETAAAPAATPAPASNDAAVEADLQALIAKIREKLRSGAPSPATLADEIKQFDVILAKYAGQKSDAVANVAVMKAMLYIEVFEDTDTGLPLLRQLAKDFPDTEAGKQAPQIIAQIEQKAAAGAATALGKPFAPFKETATNGAEVDLAAYKGKVVLVDFWATWCGPCVGELPHVKEAYEKFHAQGFEIIGVSLDKDGQKLAAFTKENGMAWPQIFDGKGWQNKLAQAYGIDSIPATFLLDRDGNIAAKGLRGDALSAKVAELLAAKP